MLSQPVAALQRAGYSPGRVLGAGVEGVVLDLGSERVAKLWRSRVPAELTQLQLFYDALDASIATPRILQILEVDGQAISIEARLSGSALRESMGDAETLVSDAEIHALVTVLAALGDVPVRPELSLLPVLPGEGPCDPSGSFPVSLAALVKRRFAAFEGVMGNALRDAQEVSRAVVSRLLATPLETRTLLHGDLIPGNVLISPDGDVSAVVDFGFLSTVGDPAFDVAVTASVFDMYGSHARASERLLDQAFAECFGVDAERVGLYRAAYALVTSNCFSLDGSDGHFAWCMDVLRRPDVRDAVGL